MHSGRLSETAQRLHQTKGSVSGRIRMRRRWEKGGERAGRKEAAAPSHECLEGSHLLCIISSSVSKGSHQEEEQQRCLQANARMTTQSQDAAPN